MVYIKLFKLVNLNFARIARPIDRVEISVGLPRYEITEAHEAIVDQATFDKAQEIREERAARLNTAGKDYTARYPFSGLIVCACCGAHYRRKR